MTLEAGAPRDYLGADEIVQSDHPAIVAVAQDLRSAHDSDADVARTAFEWVRDTIGHSWDRQDPRVTLTASEVLEAGVGLCYAKSHLLAALLRSQGIPTGLCYQRLGDASEGFFVHGLVAVYLDGAWYRQDPRGNKSGVNAQFSLKGERLAFQVVEAREERDYPQLYVAPAPEVVSALTAATNVLTSALSSELAATAGPSAVG